MSAPPPFLTCDNPVVVAWRLSRASGGVKYRLHVEMRYMPVAAPLPLFKAILPDWFGEGWHSHYAAPVDATGQDVGAEVRVPRFVREDGEVLGIKITASIDRAAAEAAECQAT